MSHELFIPPYLSNLGYGTVDVFKELGNRAVRLDGQSLKECTTWKPWRGILDYLCCVEYARNQLHTLPSGRAIGSINVVPARYDSASLVFFAQATLDNIALWLSGELDLDVKGSDCAFHKNKFKVKLVEYHSNFDRLFNDNETYISKLESYRQEWIHRLSGGASIFSNSSPSDPVANVQICVPIEPSINSHGTSGKHYLKKVENCRKKNGGEWLYTIDTFADLMADGCRTLVEDLLKILLDLIHESVENA